MTKVQGKLLDECFHQPTFLSALECITSDFLLKSQTNFYIPPQAYAGYSYLDHVEVRHHGPHLFVQAEPTNFHPHHQIPSPQSNHTRFMSFESHILSKHGSLVFPSTTRPLNNPMTIPYIHPQLNIPVPLLQLPWHFGALCFSFTLGGMMMLHWTPKWILLGNRKKRHWFPYRTFAWSLILFQGPCSFLADYVHMSNNSLWHLIDRFLACVLMCLEFIKLVTMRPYTRPVVYAIYLLLISMAMYCFMKSQESQRELDADGFVFWHCGWHCYPLTGILVVGLEKWLIRHYGEYYSFEYDGALMNRNCKRSERTYKRGEGGGMLLSTVVMEYFYGIEQKQPMDKHLVWKR